MLLRLALGSPEGRSDTGEMPGSIRADLACTDLEFESEMRRLEDDQLIETQEDIDDIRLLITSLGRVQLDEWLAGILPLFAGWPPSNTTVDDAIE